MSALARRSRGSRGRLLAVLTAAATLAVGSAPASGAGFDAASSGHPTAVRVLPKAPYQFTIRAGAVENFVNFYRELVSSVGYSHVRLAHDEGAPLGRATAAGAGYWLVTDDEPCLFGCDPPCPTGEIVNPTIARTTFPTSCEPRRPGLNPAGVPAEVDNSLPAPAWPQSFAEARTDVAGNASGRNTELTLPAGVRLAAAGSTAIASVSRDTGEYSGTARTYVSELVTPTGDLASITSLMRVTTAPNSVRPRVTYLLSLANATGGGARTEVDEQGFTIAGVDIPAGDLVAHFNSQLAGLAKSVGALGELGLELLAPEVGQSYDGRRYRIAAPVFSLGADPSVAKTTPARECGVRLAAAVFEGSYATPDPVLRSVRP